MTNISKKLEKLILSSKEILPVKTEEGILVGSVLIRSNGPLKDLYKHSKLIYKEIHLNVVAIRIANLLARNQQGIKTDALYKADQEYGKWFIDSQILRNQYQKAVNNNDHDRADIFWARYCESRDRTITAKNHAETLAAS